MRSYVAYLALFLLGCQPSQSSKNNNMERDSFSSAGDWISLFDGKTTSKWRGFNSEIIPPNWIVEDGALKSLGTGGDVGGDIVYGEQEFENFELELEWKISKGGNSGIFYHVVEGDKYKAPYETAPEYQLIDDLEFSDPLEDWQKVGADYAMYFESDKNLKPAGEWNTSRIYFTLEKAQYWLNGKISAEFVPYSEDWLKKRNSGKWDDFPDYAKSKKGLIGLQDHGSFIWFRNIRIREL